MTWESMLDGTKDGPQVMVEGHFAGGKRETENTKRKEKKREVKERKKKKRRKRKEKKKKRKEKKRKEMKRKEKKRKEKRLNCECQILIW